jgi:hypothetical protein
MHRNAFFQFQVSIGKKGKVIGNSLEKSLEMHFFQTLDSRLESKGKMIPHMGHRKK